MVVELLDEDDNVVYSILFEALEALDEIVACVFAEGPAFLKQSVDLWVFGGGIEDVGSYILDDVVEVHIEGGAFIEVVAVRSQKLL